VTDWKAAELPPGKDIQGGMVGSLKDGAFAFERAATRDEFTLYTMRFRLKQEGVMEMVRLRSLLLYLERNP
jgi:hypothetical protein